MCVCVGEERGVEALRNERGETKTRVSKATGDTCDDTWNGGCQVPIALRGNDSAMSSLLSHVRVVFDGGVMTGGAS